MKSHKLLYAENQRTIQRHKKITLFSNKVKKLIENNWCCQNPIYNDNEYYKNQIQAIEIAIQEIAKSRDEEQLGSEIFAQFVSNYNKTNRTNFEIPNVSIKVKRLKQSRNIISHIKSREVCHFAQKFETYLSQPEFFVNASFGDLTLALSVSLMLFGRITNEDELLSFLRTINKKTKLSSINIVKKTHYYLNIEYHNKNIQNIKDNSATKNINYQTRIFFDTQSLAIFRLWLKFATNQTYKSSSSKLIFNQLKKISYKINASLIYTKNIKSFMQGCIAYYESLESVKLPNILTEISQVKINNADLLHQFWNTIQNKTYHTIEKISFSDFNNFPTFKPQLKNSNQNIYYQEIKSEIKNAIQAKHKDGSKVTPTVAIVRLKAIKTNSWPFFQKALVLWFIERLTTKKNKAVSSLNTYFSQIFNLLAILESENNIQHFTSEDFETYYKEQLEKIDKNATNNNTSITLTLFHRFCENHYNLPILKRSIVSCNNNSTTVNAGYISYALYRELVRELSKLKNIDHNSLISIQLIVVIAYRGGCRISELTSAQIKDLELSSDYYFIIRSNKYSNIKTAAGKRRLHLKSLLSNDEFKLLQNYLSLRMRKLKNNNELLFCHFDTPTISLQNYTISNLVSYFLRKLSGNKNYVFHHLRHTAISNLFLVASQEFELAQEFTQLPAIQLKDIFIKNINSLDSVNETFLSLSYLCGHSSPNSTFSSYIHFVKLVSHLKLSRTAKTYSRTYAKNIFAISEKKLTQLKKQYKNLSQVPTEFLQSHIDKKMKSSTKEAINPETSKLPTTTYPIFLKPQTHYSYSDIYACLKLYEDDTSPCVIANKFGIDFKHIERWINNALALRALKTRQNQPRLIAKSRLEKNSRTITLTKPLMVEDIIFSDRILKNLDVLYKSDQSIMDEVIYFLENSVTTRSGISFNSSKRLEQFLTNLEPAIHKKYWRLLVTNEETKKQLRSKFTKLNITLDKSRKSSNANNSFYLHLSNLANKKALAHSSSSAKFIFHLFYIMNKL